MKRIATELAWQARRDREHETDTHPCDHWDADTCMCKGACSCHWVEDSDPDIHGSAEEVPNRAGD